MLLLAPIAKHTDQIDAVAHLRDHGAADDAVEHRGDVLRADPQLPRAVLSDLDLQDLLRLVPIVGDAANMLVFLDHTGEFLRQRSHRLDIRPADPILNWTPDRRPELERVHQYVDADELRARQLGEPLLHAVARLDALG